MCLRVSVVLGVTLLIAPVLARPGCASNDPAGFVADVAQQATQILEDTQLSTPVRRQEFTELVDRNFDVRAIAQFTLGSYWRLATPLQRRQFLGVLGGYLVNLYWSHLQPLQKYPGERLTVMRETPLSAASALIASQFRWSGRLRPVELDWTVTAQGGGYKIIDLSIDNVNQLLVERSQFRDLLARNGGSLPALIAQMEPASGELTG